MYPAGVRGEPARSQPHQHQVAVALPTGEMALAGTTRAIVGTPHQRAVAIPVSLIGRTQDRTAALRLGQAGPHPEIIIKSEKA